MSRQMTDDERRRFLLEGTRTAKVATVRKDGRPHVTPVWFTLDGDDVLFAVSSESIKARTLRRDPRVSVCVDLEQDPYAFVAVEGYATLVDDPATVGRWYRTICSRYGAPAEPSSGADGDPYNRPVGLLVRVQPDRIVAVSYDS